MNEKLEYLVPYYKAAKDNWPSAKNLDRLYSALELSYQNDSVGLIEHIKSFIESICLTILTDYGESIENSTPTTTEILSNTLRIIGLENTRGISKIDKVLSGYNKIADGISEMRNETGILAHGKDGFIDTIEKEHLRSFLFAGNSILCLLLAALEGKEPDIRYTREPYERFSRFNSLIDDAVSTRVSIDEDQKLILVDFIHEQSENIIPLILEPSRVLYSIDREAYIEFMEISKTTILDAEIEEKFDKPLRSIDHKPIIDNETQKDSISLIYDEYEGVYDIYLQEFVRYLKSIIEFDNENSYMKIASSVFSLLEDYEYPEWKSRDVLKAKIITSIKRIISHFDKELITAKEISEKIFFWLKTNIIED